MLLLPDKIDETMVLFVSIHHANAEFIPVKEALKFL